MNDPRYADLLRAVAAFRNYAPPDRASLWEERFGFGIPDIEQVFETTVCGEPWLLPPQVPQRELHPQGEYHVPALGTDLPAASAVQIAQQVRSRALSPLEIAKSFLARIEAHRHLNAFITVDPARVVDDAEELAIRLNRGEDLGPLAGVPVAIKDLMSIRGYPLTAGTRAIEAKVQPRDAPLVARLRDAGALIVGTTNLHELAFGVTSANPHFGAVQNPRLPGHIPGGSSGGSAAALAAGLAAVTVGSCTGGSIRQPAACCGVVGFKGTWGAVPTEGVIPLAWSLDHVGPLTRSVEDAALAFEVMAGLPAHSMLPPSASMPPRIVRPRQFFFDFLEDEVGGAIERVLPVLEKSGASIAPCDIPGIELAPGIQLITIGAEATQANWHLLREHGDRLGEDVRVRLEIGQFYLAADYIKAQQLRRQVRASVLAAFGDADVMLVPAMPVLPPKSGTTTVRIGGRDMHVAPLLTRFTSPFNFCGFPAISLPCGKSAGGAPVNVQLVGRPGADACVLQAARWCERVFAEQA
jgi:Asp-tRNA(Asn)/Glu-tRNA(Gln) amidotransferase A subunit family amidase